MNIPSRRAFLAASGAAAFSVVSPAAVRGDAANARVRLGIIGCGGRGGWIADLFIKHGGFELTALADYFQDRVDEVGEKFNVSAGQRYTGLDCYKRLLTSGGVDAVAIISPPWFHPEQAAAAVAAGKHVYLAKPVAVDAPGSLEIERIGAAATTKQRVMLVDFQTRANPMFIEGVKRTHDGAIGDLVFGEAAYHANELDTKAPDSATPENRLRNWVFDQRISGDIIVEQNIHTLDVMSWIMGKPPVHAEGTGGRKVRTNVGDCWDYFTLVYNYGNGTGIAFASHQFKSHGSPGGIVNRMFGTQGVLETKYGGEVLIRGENFWRGGSSGAIYKDGVAANIASFHASITAGRVDNPTVAPSVRSNLVAILGRTAAYENRRVTWDELLKVTKRIDADLDGLRA